MWRIPSSCGVMKVSETSILVVKSREASLVAHVIFWIEDLQKMGPG